MKHEIWTCQESKHIPVPSSPILEYLVKCDDTTHGIEKFKVPFEPAQFSWLEVLSTQIHILLSFECLWVRLGCSAVTTTSCKVERNARRVGFLWRRHGGDWVRVNDWNPLTFILRANAQRAKFKCTPIDRRKRPRCNEWATAKNPRYSLSHEKSTVPKTNGRYCIFDKSSSWQWSTVHCPCVDTLGFRPRNSMDTAKDKQKFRPMGQTVSQAFGGVVAIE